MSKAPATNFCSHRSTDLATLQSEFKRGRGGRSFPPLLANVKSAGPPLSCSQSVACRKRLDQEGPESEDHTLSHLGHTQSCGHDQPAVRIERPKPQRPRHYPDGCGKQAMRQILVLTMLLTWTAPIHAMELRKPNILFIAVDDLRCELGCYGVAAIQSPNIDRLASRGVVFQRAYCQQAVCNPSRVSLMTGLRPDTTRVWDLVTDFRTTIPDAVTIPQHFRTHGYRALSYGKVFHNTFPDNVSWDEPHRWPEKSQLWSDEAKQRLGEFRRKMQDEGKPAAAIRRMRPPAVEIVDIPDNQHIDGAIADQAIAAMHRLAKMDQPFFLATGFIRPHLPFVVPRKYWELYDRNKISLAANPFLPRGMPGVAFGNSSLGGLYELRDYMDYFDAPSPFERSLAESQQRELKHGYYAAVSFVDVLVGRLLDELDRHGLMENTIVVLWGDHGWKLGEHNGWCKQTNYEIDTRSPLIIRAPGAKANGKQSHALVEFVDIYPTLCDLAGLPVPKRLEGVSLAPLLRGTADQVKDAVFSQFPRKHAGCDYIGYAVRTERYRYVEWWDRGTGKIAARELYDHESDAEENQNIAEVAANADTVAELSARLARQFDVPTARVVRATRKDRPQLIIVNHGQQSVDVCWLPEDGARRRSGTVRPEEELYDLRADPDQLRNVAADARHAATLVAMRKRLMSELRASEDPLLAPQAKAAETSRPILQIINGSRQPIDVYWLKSDGERVTNGTVAPGKDTFITTTLGHRFAIVAQRDKSEVTVTSEVPVQAFRFDPPNKDGVPSFYTQRVSADGFPIVASAKVNLYALKEAAYLVDLMLAKRPDVRTAMIRSGARLCVLAHDEFTTHQPEFVRLGERPMAQFPEISGKDYWDARARGMGGSERDPYCSCAEENLLGYPGDPFAAECILIHELAHNIHLRGLVNVDPTFDGRLKATYDAAMTAGLWKGKYSSVNHHEYFAEGVQSWFDDNRENDHDHNHVNTRRELIEYDPGLAAICREVFGETEFTYTKPATRLHGHLQGYDPSSAPTFAWPERLNRAREEIRRDAEQRKSLSQQLEDGVRKTNDPGSVGNDGEAGSDTGQHPNVLFIAVDDLNDWVGCLGGHPQAKTPNLDRLAASGVLFANAYCPAASCNPSRSAIMSGIPPHRSGLYNNMQKMRQVMPDAELIPKYFSRHGYHSAGSGKILHYFIDSRSWDDYFPAKESEDPFPRTFYPQKRPVSLPYEPWMYVECDWAALDVTLDQYGGDYLVADWIGRQLQREHEKPFFLACGIYRPHLPWFVPKSYYALFPLDDIQLPPGVKEDDLDDVPEEGQRLAADRYLPYIRKQGKWREGVQAYLASIAFADDMVGRVLEALDKGPHRHDTIVVLWSDHGWHLGEKEHWRKFTGWRVCDRVPLMVRVPQGAPGLPGGTAPGSVCSRPVNLVDLFKTLNELCGLPPKDDIGGNSLVPLLAKPQADWPHTSITFFGGPDRYAVSTERWRYIHYRDGGEELYDVEADRYEWTNLVGRPDCQKQLVRMRSLAPQQRSPAAQTELGGPGARPERELSWNDLKPSAFEDCDNSQPESVPRSHQTANAGLFARVKADPQ